MPSDWSASDPRHALDLYFDALGSLLGSDRLGYRNHCQRVLIHFRAFAPGADLAPVVPALVFHDIALWTHDTVDYIDPSSQLAREHCATIGRENWAPAVGAMIEWHHKQTTYRGPHAEFVEPLRRADMSDFTFGILGGSSASARREAREFPNAGFHKMLLRRTIGRLLTKPWSPAPMMRW